MEGLRLRIHGDLGLDRILFIGKDFVFTGFDGLPWLSLQERRSRFSPLQDVARVIRDVMASAGEEAVVHSEAPAALKDVRAWADLWARLSAGIFLDGYFKEAGGSAFLPASEEDRSALIEAFLLERAAFDIQNPDVSPEEMDSALRIFLSSATGVTAGVKNQEHPEHPENQEKGV
jgi:predicted trehalose synthase